MFYDKNNWGMFVTDLIFILKLFIDVENTDSTEAQSNNIESIKQACPCELPNCPSASLAPHTLTQTSTKHGSKTLIKGTGIPSINIKPSEEVPDVVESLNIKQGCEYL